MIISRVKIIAFQAIIAYRYCILLEMTVIILMGRKISGCLEIPDLPLETC